ncbi:MAG: IS21-like element helper ATPase IstB [Planctomycetota bacterium]
MLAQQTYDKLVFMKLHDMARAFRDFLDQGTPTQLSFEERLGMLVDREWDERQNRRLTRRLQTAKLRESACVEDIDYRHARHLDRSVMERLATCQWIRNRENVVITGATGVGKTWLSCALAHKACREGFTVLYARLPRLLHHLHVARADGSYVRELTRLARADLLVLDDWGLSPLADTERRDLLEVADDRDGRRSTIVASQLPVAKWHDTVGDPTLADAIMDRLVAKAHRIELAGPTLRPDRKPPAD